ncbi:MAG: arginine deiminase-related protein [Stenotrophomonas sp.]
MITRDAGRFLEVACQAKPDFGPATAKAAFLVAPDGFAHAAESAGDNRYMAASDGFDRLRALQQHRGLQAALSEDVPVVCFPGHPDMPDGVFPNNVFATAPQRLVVGRMRHPVRQREATRADIRTFFSTVMGYRELDLSTQEHPCELTGALVIDRARGLGFCGLSERCDEAGAALMHQALGLRATWMFDLAEGEYHTNVLLALLAGRAALFCADGFAQPMQAALVLEALYGRHLIRLSPAEHAAFAGNAIALSGHTVWMSQGAADALCASSRQALADAGFAARGVALDAIEAAGGSLRCCVAEIF